MPTYFEWAILPLKPVKSFQIGIREEAVNAGGRQRKQDGMLVVVIMFDMIAIICIWAP